MIETVEITYFMFSSLTIGALIGVYIVTLIVHEIGHAIVLKAFSKKDHIIISFNYPSKGTIYCGVQEDYNHLTNKQLCKVYMSGVLLGLVPIGIASFYFEPLMYLTIPYLYSCREDIKNYFKTKRMIK